MTRKQMRPALNRKPPLTITRILAWADDYKRRVGRWPNHLCGRIRWTEETWLGIDSSLRTGHRGLTGGSSLANVLYLHRGVRSPGNVPPLDEREILRWARAHFRRTTKWPSLYSGAVRDAPGETWCAIDLALSRGTRRLAGGSSVAQLLADAGIKPNHLRQPRLTTKQILNWADAHFERHGEWPARNSGPIAESPLEKWSMVDKALKEGRRGLRGGSSIAAFLNRHRGLYKGKSRRPKRIRESDRLRNDEILAWGRMYRRCIGNWPNRDSGRVNGVSGLTWMMIDSALKRGNRGLAGGSSLSKLFQLPARRAQPEVPAAR